MNESSSNEGSLFTLALVLSDANLSSREISK